MTSEQIDEFLHRTLVGVISTVDSVGRPRSAPIWFTWEEGAAYMFTGRTTLKWRNIMRKPYASFCVDWREPPYASVIMHGPVEEVSRPLYDLVLGMALRYYGEEKGRAFAEGYRDEPKSGVVFRLVPRHVASFTSDD
ncbi:MAG: pyridoxamine 5'-phosphate oxidase family protein [Chloroflexi bacterium]|nr:pyridoxamine 5'-phosphate oxidase family protein [Chloroflexota bacterium]